MPHQADILSDVAGLPGAGYEQRGTRDFFIHKVKLGLNEGYTFGRSLSGYMRPNAASVRLSPNPQCR